MANKKDLKSYVRYDGTGRVIAGGNILQRFKPKGGGQWTQTNAYVCCDPGCIPPIYGTNFLIDDVTFDDAGMTVLVSTRPGFSMQIDILNCETLNPVGDPQTVPGGAESFIVYFPAALVELGCGFSVRTICNPEFFSAWTYTF